MRTDRPLSEAIAALVAGGGLLLAASAFLSWLWNGAGSAMSLRDLGDFLLGDRWPTTSRWFGLLAYVIPVCGGVAIIGAGLRIGVARRVLAAAGLLAAVLLAVAAVLFTVRTRLPGPGFALAAVGDGLILAGWWICRRNV